MRNRLGRAVAEGVAAAITGGKDDGKSADTGAAVKEFFATYVAIAGKIKGLKSAEGLAAIKKATAALKEIEKLTAK